jgi:hypothetical protein
VGAVRAALIALLLAAASALAMPTPYEARETQLDAFESHADRLLDLDKPLYRLGEILKLRGTEQYVVPVNRAWSGRGWRYSVVDVRVRARKK